MSTETLAAPQAVHEGNGRAQAKRASVLLGVPHYGAVEANAIVGISQASEHADVLVIPHGCSLLAHNFNKIWAGALAKRRELGLTHFAMIHSDVEAPRGWLDVLLAEMDAAGADVMGVPMPLKDRRGLTSVGKQDRQTGAISRFTMRELEAFPLTFDAQAVGVAGTHDLMINTGLWACRFTEPWVEEFYFEVRDAIVRLDDGRFQARVLPEDWNASGWWARRGLKVFLTRKVKAVHHGKMGFPNHGGWGEIEGPDPGDPF